jgi:4-hydroxy-tetrahydrodipicolinate synthase
MFKGSIVALVTPFDKDKVDIPRLRELVEYHINSGTQAIVAAGTTGESGTLTLEEKVLIIKTVFDQAKERIPVIAGTAANATKACIELTEMAMEVGADAALIMTPAYIKPTQEGLYQHYSHIAHAVAIPIIAYNVPARTGCDLLPETLGKLSKISNIIGVKEATGELSRMEQILAQEEGSLDIYSGDDASAAEWLLAGAKGVISVTSNVAPQYMTKMCDAAMDKNNQLCLDLNEKLKILHQALFVEPNPIPVKWAMNRMNLIKNELRLPLLPLSKQHQASIEAELKKLNLI